MIHILCLILKVIGWILLGILGIILGILLFVLFSAIRYCVDGKKQGENLEGSVKVTWLLWIFSVTAAYQNGLRIAVKVFGRTIWKMDGREDSAAEADDVPIREPEEDESIISQDHRERAELTDSGNPKKQQALERSDAEKKKSGSNEKTLKGQPENQSGSRLEGQPENQSESRLEGQEGQPQTQGVPAEGKFLHILHKVLDGIRSRISSIIAKLTFSIQSICGKLKQTEERIGWLQEKWEMAQNLIQDPANQRSAKLIIRQLKKILKHVFPRRGKADITFGVEDPYQMGQLLSAASLLYPFTHRILELHPVFDEAVLEGEIHIRGHIRIGCLIGYVLRLLLDRNIRQQLWRRLRPSRKQDAKRSRKGKS